MFRSRILPPIIAIWGALIVVNLLLTGRQGGAYGSGQLAAGALGVVMVVAGLRAVLNARQS
jgi:hypothetical protein